MTITEFLLARIAEDEAEARGYLADLDAHPPSAYDMEQVGWIEAGSPARVLAECEAKRRIVQQAHMAVKLSDETPDDGSPAAERIHGAATAWEATLSLLAAVYADHPDYDDEWRP